MKHQKRFMEYPRIRKVCHNKDSSEKKFSMTANMKSDFDLGHHKKSRRFRKVQ